MSAISFPKGADPLLFFTFKKNSSMRSYLISKYRIIYRADTFFLYIQVRDVINFLSVPRKEKLFMVSFSSVVSMICFSVKVARVPTHNSQENRY